jgi:hypothetical protein
VSMVDRVAGWAGAAQCQLRAEHGSRRRMNATNCVDRKICDTKEPCEVIDWVTPEGALGRGTRTCDKSMSRLKRRGPQTCEARAMKFPLRVGA